MSQLEPSVYDCIVIGGGIAGASVAYELSLRGKQVLLLEAENQPGYHSTGRSAAFFAECYGNAVIRAITKFSRDFFDNPPESFSDYPLLQYSGELCIARADQLDHLQSLYDSVKDLSGHVSLNGEDFALQKVPWLKKGYAARCLWDPDAREVDVAALLHGYLRLAKNSGAEIKLGARVEALSRNGSHWHMRAGNTGYSGKTLVNAAGAWADVVAAMAGAKPIGLVPNKRTACIAPVPKGIRLRGLPLVVDVDEQFYFKPDGGNLLLSPADETPVDPMDAYSDMVDVATAVDRVNRAIDFEITRVSHEWAGLRSFVKDRGPVVGFDKGIDNFFWLAGQGGHGIQMAPGLAQLAAGIFCGEAIPDGLAAMGVDIASVTANRCQS